MKTKITRLLLILTLSCVILPAYAEGNGKIEEQIVVNIDRAGSLSEKIGEGKKYDIISMKLTGPLNGKDLQMLREMAGGGKDERGTDGSLQHLDLSKAAIVEGETYMFYNAETHKPTADYSWNNVVGTHMFSNCKRLVSISLPQTAIVIKDHAFCGCDNLKEVIIGNATKEIGNSAFAGCSSLQTIALPPSVSVIADSAFSDCSALTLIESHNTNVPLLGKNVFAGINKSGCRLLVPKDTYKVYWLSAWGDNFSITEVLDNSEKNGKKRKH